MSKGRRTRRRKGTDDYEVKGKDKVVPMLN